MVLIYYIMHLNNVYGELKTAYKKKGIFKDNFDNVYDFTKNNQKCKDFLEENEYFLNKIKKANHKIKMEKILKKIGQNEEIEKEENEEFMEAEINNINEDDININADNILFKLSNKLEIFKSG